MNITVTHKENGSLEYHECPEIPFEVGQKAKIHGRWKLTVNGETQSVYVTEIEIEDIDIEYVVDEKEFYIYYHVAHYHNTWRITTEKLTKGDISPYF